ncbi:MAG: polyphosphate kinase [Leptospiraceae bacterium]|nr:polyphosphate kinase [Leptospiraceae bacterium]MCP5497765.1 polyphosphate kinase [Leptospiraceae bacterium]
MIKLKEYEVSPSTDKNDADEAIKDLQERLFIAFRKLYQQKYSAIVLIEGWAGAGKGDLIQNITMRLDPRKIRVFSYVNDDYAYDGYHFLKKFWNRLPGYGESVIFNGSWYGRVCYESFNKKIDHVEYNSSFRSILNLERNLTDDKYFIFKYFLNISKQEQSKILQKAKKFGLKWMVSKDDKVQSKYYNKYKDLIEIYLNQTNTEVCPWSIVPAKNRNYSKIFVMESIIQRLEQELKIDTKKLLNFIKREETES